MMPFQELVKAFCAENHLPLSPMEQKVVFVLNKKYEVSLEDLGQESPSFVIYSALDLSASEKQLALERLMNANIFGKQTHRGVFALDPKSGKIVFFRRFDNEVTDLSYFKNEMNHFLTILSYWDKELKG